MKNFIKSILLFSLFAVILYPLLIIVWGSFVPFDALKKNLNYPIGSYGHMYSRIQNIQRVKDVDILFLGSSHAYRGFDPRIFKEYGLNTFNLGSSAQSHIQTEVLLKRYLDTINPKLIVYEVYSGTFSSDGVESSLDLIANDKGDFESIKMAVTENHIKVYNALIYGFYRDFFKLNAGYKEEAVQGEDTYIEGGFVEKKLKYFEPIKFPESSWNLKDQQFKYFERNLLLIKERHIPVILVQAPITQAMYKAFWNNTEFDERMKKYGVYYNFNELVQLNDELDFYNTNHLNQNGVEKFNRKLIELLQEKEEWLFK